MDWSAFHAVNRLSQHTTWAHSTFKLYAEDGIAIFAVLLAVAAWLAVRQADAKALTRTVWAAGGALVALALNQPIASAVDRARPYAAHHGVLLLVSKTTDPSFMSDHATVSGAVAVGLLLAVRRVGVVAIVLALVMAFARVYVGAHYPGDVVAGFVFGTAVVLVGTPVADRWLTPVVARILDSPVGRKLQPSGATLARSPERTA